MALHRNAFVPDTCDRPGCRLEFSFDDELPADQVEASFQLVAVHRKCAAHAGLTDAEVWQHARADNKRKNQLRQELIAAVPALFVSQTQADDDNRAKLLAVRSNLPTRMRNLVNAMTGDQLKAALSEYGVAATEAGEPWPGVSLSLSWSGANGTRVITVTVPALTAQEKTALNSALLAKFGGRVVVA